MMRALTLCSLLLLPLSACDDAALGLVDAADQPAAVPDPPELAPVEKCEAYCSDYLSDCGAAEFGYASISECETLCGYWESGDQLLCRFDTLEAIADDDIDSLEMACADAGPDSEACGSGHVITCDRYCVEFRATCSGDGEFEASFDSLEKCRTWCDDEPMAGDNSIECRLGALEAMAAPADCEAASPQSTCN